MRQLTCTAPGVLEWLDVPPPRLHGTGDAIVRPVAVARCELDPLLVLAGPTPAGPFAVGHEAVVEVEAVAAEVDKVRPGDVALCSFQLSCGGCASCRSGFTANCHSYPVLSDYGMQPLSGTEYGGMLSDRVRVPHADAMLVPLPGGIDPAVVASVPDNVADGYRAVAPHLRANPGADVLVVCHGAPSIALYAVQTARALGAGSVTVESDDPEVAAAARALGAEARLTEFVRRSGRWPIVVDCGTQVAGLHHAVASTAPEGVLHSVSYYGFEPMTPLPLGKLYTFGIRFFTGRVHSAAVLPQVASMVVRGELNPAAVTSEVISWDDAARRYLDPAIKLVVAR
jgi:threonine dehydrogenase-like Zn-dependent dehydrogenase